MCGGDPKYALTGTGGDLLACTKKFFRDDASLTLSSINLFGSGSFTSSGSYAGNFGELRN